MKENSGYPAPNGLRRPLITMYTPSPAGSPIAAPTGCPWGSFTRGCGVATDDGTTSSGSQLGYTVLNSELQVDTSEEDASDEAGDAWAAWPHPSGTRPRRGKTLLSPKHPAGAAPSLLSRVAEPLSTTHDFLSQRLQSSEIFATDLEDDLPLVSYRKIPRATAKPQDKPLRRVSHVLQADDAPFEGEMRHEHASWFAFRDEQILQAPLTTPQFPSHEHMVTNEIFRKNKFVSEANKAWSRKATLEKVYLGHSALAMTPLPATFHGTKRKALGGGGGVHPKRKGIHSPSLHPSRGLMNATSDELERLKLG